jgi:hypothetical protein
LWLSAFKHFSIDKAIGILVIHSGGITEISMSVTALIVQMVHACD